MLFFAPDRREETTKTSMSTQTTQLPIDYKGKRYSGVYSVSGTLMIARIPGIGSKSEDMGSEEDVGGKEGASAQRLLITILKEAEITGLL